MRILYWCNFGRMGGYSRAAHDYIMALVGAGAGVRIEPLLPQEPQWHALEPRYRNLLELVNQGVITPDRDVEIFHAPPAVLARLVAENILERNVPPLGYRPKMVALTTWETSPLPTEYAEVLRRFDALIVPSQFCADLMETPETVTYVVPHCFDPDFWDPDEALAAEADDRTTFYTIGAWNDRKNQVGLLKAYLHAFTKADPVRMVVAAHGADLRQAMSLLTRSGMPKSEWPNMVILPPEHMLHEAELRQLHADSNVFVSASRGEGWNLGLFEARVMGKAAITPARTGEADYLVAMGPDGTPEPGEPDGVYRVPARLAPVFPDEGPATVDAAGRVTASITAPRGTNCKQVWLEPDLVAMAKIMRAVADTGSGVEHPGIVRSAMEERYSYRAVGQKLMRVLEGICR